MTNRPETNITARLDAWEAGTLGDNESIKLFQDLINSGLLSHLPEKYQKRAKAYVEAGLCTLPVIWN